MSRSKEEKDLLVSLDIGTSKVACLVAEYCPETQFFNVIGVGEHRSTGIKKGIVVNIEATVTAIQKALQEVELMTDCRVVDVYTGIAGNHIRSINSHGMVAIKDKEVSEADIDRVIEIAQAVPIPADQQILHILTQEFIVDGQDGVKDPRGMSGIRLEVRIHIVTGGSSAAQNIVKCVQRCGLVVNSLILQPLASSMATLTSDEKELGVCLVDIGGGTTDMAVFTQGAIRHTTVIPIAGDHVTNDIAMALRIPTQDAEELKRQHGCALEELADDHEIFEVSSIGDRGLRRVTHRALAAVIRSRMEELLELIERELGCRGFTGQLSSGIVLTGGCASMLGMVELAENVLHIPVRLGVPRYDGALVDVVRNPKFSTAYGLLLEACSQRVRRQQFSRSTVRVKDVLVRMKMWFQTTF